MSKRENSIRPGDKFVKAGRFKSTWVVKRMLELRDLPPHLHIAPVDQPNRTLTFSVSALLDKSLFRKVEGGDEQVAA